MDVKKYDKLLKLLDDLGMQGLRVKKEYSYEYAKEDDFIQLEMNRTVDFLLESNEAIQTFVNTTLTNEFFINPEHVDRIIAYSLKRLEKALFDFDEAKGADFRLENCIKTFKLAIFNTAEAISDFCTLYKFERDFKELGQVDDLKRLITKSDERVKHHQTNAVKAYSIYRIFGKHIDGYIDKPEQIELYNLITGSSGNDIYNKRFGKELDPIEKKRLDKKLDTYQRKMK
jgi:hypothetical protein